jgi:hypothetical protein
VKKSSKAQPGNKAIINAGSMKRGAGILIPAPVFLKLRVRRWMFLLRIPSFRLHRSPPPVDLRQLTHRAPVECCRNPPVRTHTRPHHPCMHVMHLSQLFNMAQIQHREMLCPKRLSARIRPMASWPLPPPVRAIQAPKRAELTYRLHVRFGNRMVFRSLGVVPEVFSCIIRPRNAVPMLNAHAELFN